MSNRPIEYAQDYPVPPALEHTDHHVRATASDTVVAETRQPIRILEKGHPPTFYFPPNDVQQQYLEPSPKRTTCEFKGEASYYHLVVGDVRHANTAWYYPNPKPGYEDMADYVAFYASALDEATVDGEKVDAQAGRFYGGWITGNVQGPFKGGPQRLNL